MAEKFKQQKDDSNDRLKKVSKLELRLSQLKKKRSEQLVGTGKAETGLKTKIQKMDKLVNLDNRIKKFEKAYEIFVNDLKNPDMAVLRENLANLSELKDSIQDRYIDSLEEVWEKGIILDDEKEAEVVRRIAKDLAIEYKQELDRLKHLYAALEKRYQNKLAELEKKP